MKILRFNLLKTLVDNLKIGFSNWFSGAFHDLGNTRYSANPVMGEYFHIDISTMLNNI